MNKLDEIQKYIDSSYKETIHINVTTMDVGTSLIVMWLYILCKVLIALKRAEE